MNMAYFDGLFTEVERPKTSSVSNKYFDGLFSSAQAKKQRLQSTVRQADKANSFGGIVKETIKTPANWFMEGVKSVETQPKSFSELVKDPYLPLKAGSKNLFDTLNDSAKRLQDWGQTISDPKTSTAKKVAATGEVGMGWLNNMFTAFSAPLAALSPVPGVGNVADMINQGFAGIMNIGGKTAEEGVNALPISEKTKQEIMPLSKELGGLLVMAAAGKGGADIVGKVKSKTLEINRRVQEDVRIQIRILSESGETKIPIRTPSTKHAEYARSQGYEPYTRPEDLPIIRFGKKERTLEPTIQLSERLSPSLPKGARLVPETTVQAPKGEFDGLFRQSPIPTRPERLTGAEPAIESRMQRTTQELLPEAPTAIKPIESTGEKRVSTLAEKMEALAIEKELTDSFGKLPEYSAVNWGEQLQFATQVYKGNPAQALRILRGEEMPPSNILLNAFAVAIEKLAIRAGDTALLKTISDTSSLRSTRYGQEIGILSQREQLSPVKIMSDVKRGREEAFEKKTGKSVAKATQEEVSNMKKEIKKNASKRQDWDSFIKEIQCGY